MTTLQTATFANGCFWCTEAVFTRLKGVETVTSGYSGGTTENPSYEDVSSGMTGHAEAIQITFDPKIISYEKLLKIFFATHDPTTFNRQGNDIGTEYRSAIFYHDDEQKQAAEKIIKYFEKEAYYQDPIVTEVVPFKDFYEAEDYHKNYYEKYGSAPYCRIMIDPKIKKLLNSFKDDVKEEYQS